MDKGIGKSLGTALAAAIKKDADFRAKEKEMAWQEEQKRGKEEAKQVRRKKAKEVAKNKAEAQVGRKEKNKGEL